MNNFDMACKKLWSLENLQHGFEQLGYDTELEAETLWIAKGNVILATIDRQDGLTLADRLPDGVMKSQICHLFVKFLLGHFGSEYALNNGLNGGSA